MQPDKIALSLYQGDDYTAFVTVVIPTGDAADLTGFTARSQIRQGAADEFPDLVAEIAAAIQLPNTILLTLPHAATTTMSGKVKYAWDLELINPAGEITTILAGDVYVTLEVTR